MPRKKLADTTEFVLAMQKLLTSGLAPSRPADLGLDVLSGAEVMKIAPAHGPFAAIRFNYLHPITRQPLSDWPMAAPYWRLRYLEQPAGFAEVATGKELRYVQPAQTVPVAYYPVNAEWSTILDDASTPIIITEGELKAIKACEEGFPTIGLGGVNSWRALQQGVTWLSSLDLPNWIGRHVYICYDSDMRSNSNVLLALARLAEELEQRGAHPYVISLPDLFDEGVKVGLDDFLVSEAGGADEFNNLLHEAIPLGLARALHQLNDRYIYVSDPGLIITESTNSRTSPVAFRDHVASTTIYVAREFEKDGKVRTKTVSGAAEWLKWPLRRAVDKMTYAPGREKFIIGPPSAYNSWPGWGMQPKQGDVSLFLRLVDHLFAGADPGAKEWFLRWCAYPLQYPGVKLFTCVLIWGRCHGTGKSLIAYTLGKIYGKNFTEIKQDDLRASHNEWAENRQLVLGDDVTGSHKREDADLLRKIITQREVRLNPKYIPAFTIPDVINYFFTANHCDVFFMEDDDRRNFIHEVSVLPLPEEFYAEYDLWMDGNDGPAAVFDYLLNLDTGDFNPSARAMNTSAKQQMIDATQSDLGSWVRRLRDDSDSVLRVGAIALKRDLFTNRELLRLYDPEHRTGTTAGGLGRELRRAGFIVVNRGQPVRLADGLDRLYAIRSPEKWIDAPAADLVGHVTDALKQPGPKY